MREYMRAIFTFAAVSMICVSANSAITKSFDRVLVKCGPPAGDLVNGTYVTVGLSKQKRLFARVTEYKKGEFKRRVFAVKPMRCPCPKAYEGDEVRLQVSDFSMSWLTQGPKKSNYLATLELKRQPNKDPKTLGVSCRIL